MHALLRLAATSLAVTTAKRRMQRAIHHSIVLLAASAVAMAGLGFLVSAMWIWVAMQTTPLIASLVAGGVILVIAALIYVIGEMSGRTEIRPAALADPMASIATQIRSMPAINPPSIGGLLAIIGAGYILGRVAARR